MTEHPDTFKIGGELEVNRLGYGAMQILGSNFIGPPSDEENARNVVSRAIELGVNFIDTADAYGPGVSERLIREALHPYPDDLVIATKGGLMREPGGEWIRNADPLYLKHSFMMSRDRLKLDSIDLYQLHRVQNEVPLEDSLTALAEMKDLGYIEYIGLSEVDANELEDALDIVDVASVQNRYSVNDREHDEVLELCEEKGIGFIPWFPLGSGNLGSAGDVLTEVADAHDVSIYQIGLAWLLHRSDVMLPIPGTSSIEHLEENIESQEITLSDEEMKKLDSIK